MADYGAGISGAASGAISGASIGGPWGGVIGGALGGLGGLFGGGKKKKKRSAFDKKQKQLNENQHQAIFGQGPLADLYNYDPEQANAVFDKTRARPAQRNFAEKIVPEITGAFRKEGLQNSSYVGDALSKAGRNVQENLDALRAQYLYGEQNDARSAKRNAVENLQNRSSFAYDTAPKSGGFNIGDITSAITPEILDQAKTYFSKKPGVA